MSMADELAPGLSAANSAIDLTALLAAINAVNGNDSDPVLIDQIALLERIKSSCAAAQVRLTHTFTVSQSTDSAADKVDPDVTRRSVAGQIALARRDSRHNGSRHLGAAHALMTEMPYTLGALARGDLSERRAHLIIEQFGCLTPTDRRRADALLAPDMPGLGNRTAQSRAAAVAYKIDPEAVMGKIRGAVKDRNVTLRPAPDTMSRLSALLPVAQGVAVWAALHAAANQSVAAGDARGRGQLMADHLVSKVTGAHLTGCDPYGVPRYGSAGEQDHGNREDHAPAVAVADTAVVAATVGSVADVVGSVADVVGSDADVDVDVVTDVFSDETPSVAFVPIHSNRATSESTASATGGFVINLVMTDRTLLGDDAPAQLQGYGPIPAALARALVTGQADQPTRTWVRRLYTDPHTGQLAAMDSRQRLFPQSAKDFLLARDQTCRTPWCDAPIRHLDHITPHHRGGPTSVVNGQGLCEACNHTKQAPHWRSSVTADGTVLTRTPTGHTYPGNPPPPPKSTPWPDISTIESGLIETLFDAA